MFLRQLTKANPKARENRLMIVSVLGCMALTSYCVRRSGNGTGPEADVLITGGKETAGFPAVVYLATPSGSTCTGTFISDQILLTAAHCFKSEQDKATVGGARSIKIRIHPEYTHPKNDQLSIKESAFDIALVQFPPKTGKSTLPLAQAAPKSGDKVVLVGYGSTTSDKLDTKAIKRSGTSVLKDNVRGVLIVSGSNGASVPSPKVSSPTQAAKPDNKVAKVAEESVHSSVGPGDSGGPLLSADGSSILGVTSSVAASDGPVSFAMFADIGSPSSQSFFRKAAADGMFPRDAVQPTGEPLDEEPSETSTGSEAPPIEAGPSTQPDPNVNPGDSSLPPPPEEVVRSLKTLGAARVYTIARNCRDMRDKPWFVGASVIYADREGHFLWTCNLDNPMQLVVRGDCDKGLDSSTNILRCR